MAQLVVRNLDPEVKERLRARAKRLGRSLEAEARSILAEAAEAELPVVPEPGLGTRLAAHFRGIGVELDLSTFRGRPLHGVDFDK